MTVSVLWLFLTVPWVGLQCVIVVFPDHTHLLFCGSVKLVLSGHFKIDKTKILMTNGSLMKVESIANRSLKPILVFFLSGRLRHVLL